MVIAHDHDLSQARWYKGVPDDQADRPLSAFAEQGIRLLDDRLMLPAAILKQSALDHNARWMKAFLRDNGIDIAPHGKTTMSPELFERQLRDGAWAMTAATAHHVRLYAEFGVPRILMANQLVGRANIAAVLNLLRDRPDLDFYCLVDSVEGAALLAGAVGATGLGRPLKVLLELGGEGGRTGVRTLEEALRVAAACAARKPHLLLCGVEAFEGVYSDVENASSLLAVMAEAAEQIDRQGLFGSDEVLITAGGSAFFDEAAKALLSTLRGKPTRLVLRSGCYVTHDSRLYERAVDAVLERRPELAALGRPRAALEIWAHVQSRPEPNLAIASMGKRDASYDVEPPVPLWTFRPNADDKPRPVSAAIRVTKLYDQHACLEVPAEADLRVGDLIGFGISHPCTTFDKWKALFVVDDDYRVVGTVRTFF